MHLLTKMYFDLLEYCELSGFDVKIFKVKSDEYAKRWSRETISDQGMVCEEINQFLKGNKL